MEPHYRRLDLGPRDHRRVGRKEFFCVGDEEFYVLGKAGLTVRLYRVQTVAERKREGEGDKD